jgi:predicted ABC-type ATPase
MNPMFYCRPVEGPNGTGKSTAALPHSALAVDEFVNADVIARGLLDQIR